MKHVTNRNLVMLFVAGLTAICIAVCYLSMTAYFSSAEQKSIVDEKYMLDIPAILGPNWISDKLLDVNDRRDTFDWYEPSVVASRRRYAYRKQTKQAFFDQLVMEYSDATVAAKRYLAQEGFIFQDSTSPTTKYTWESPDFSKGLSLKADSQHIACMNIYDPTTPSTIINTTCVYFLSYSKYVVYMNIWSQRGGIEYISREDLKKLLLTIDEVFTST